MTVKKGKIKIINGSVDGTPHSIQTEQYVNVVNKIDGNYEETLLEILSQKSYISDETGQLYEIDNSSEAGKGYRVYPTSIDGAIDEISVESNRTITWLEDLVVI